MATETHNRTTESDSLRSNGTFVQLVFGLFASYSGRSLFIITGMWLVHMLGGSPFYTGLAGFLIALPRALRFLTGPLVDRWPLGRILVVTQGVQVLLVLTIPLIATIDTLTIGVVLVVLPLLSIADQFIEPTETAALPRIVHPHKLVESNSAVMFVYTGAQFVVNALGGILIGLLGAVSLFVINSVIYAVAVLLFATLRIPSAATTDDTSEESSLSDDPPAMDGAPAAETSTPSEYLSDLKVGIRYLWGSLFVVFVIGDFIANFAFGVALAVLPAFADQLGGPAIYGAILAILAAGTLFGAIVAGPLKQVPVGQVTIVGLGIAGVAWFGAVSSSWLPLTFGLFFIAGIPVGVIFVVIQAVIQTVVPSAMLGRVSAVLLSVEGIAVPLGSLSGGGLGSVFSVVTVMLIAAGGFILAAIYYTMHSDLRSLPAIEAIDLQR